MPLPPDVQAFIDYAKQSVATRPLRMMETVQRSEGGGWPLTNESADHLVIGHGEGVYLIAKRDLVELVQLLRPFIGPIVEIDPSRLEPLLERLKQLEQ